MSIIQLENISFKYDANKRDQPIVNDLSLNIEKGTLTVLYGKSGSGKTTMLNIIAGLLKPQNGKVIVNNQNLCDMSRKELEQFRAGEIGFIFQMFYLIPQFSAVDNVVVGMKNNKKKYREKKKEALNILEMFAMEAFANDYPEYLSGGQQQRIAIARAIANDSKIILADEPTGNLDKETAEGMLEILRNLSKRGKTVLLVSHDDRVKEYCDQVIYMEKLQNIRR